jgi:hypothetical protein
MTTKAKDEWTISVPEAARRYLGIKSTQAAYAAAHAGTIPTIRVGRLLRVPVRAMERLLDSVGTEANAT